MIKKNSANLFSFLSLLDNLFIWSHLTSCRQTYLPMDISNPSSKAHVYTHTHLLSHSISNLYCNISAILVIYSQYIYIYIQHRCVGTSCTCLLLHTSLVFHRISVVMGTRRTFMQTSLSI